MSEECTHSNAVADEDVAAVVAALREIGIEKEVIQAPEYGYENLVLCIIDMVFSLRQHYKLVRRTVGNFINYWDGAGFSPEARSKDLSLSKFLVHTGPMTADFMAEEVFDDRHKAPGCGDLLKAAVIVDVAKRLVAVGVETTDDFRRSEDSEAVRDAVLGTRGVGNVGFRYLLMLAGDENEAKPDSWLLEFLQDDVLNRKVTETEAVALIQAASSALISEKPSLTTRALDHIVWVHKSSGGNGGGE